jgi:hypothetical protein
MGAPILWTCSSGWLGRWRRGSPAGRRANYANEVGEMHELAAEDVGEPTQGESG